MDSEFPKQVLWSLAKNRNKKNPLNIEAKDENERLPLPSHKAC